MDFICVARNPPNNIDHVTRLLGFVYTLEQCHLQGRDWVYNWHHQPGFGGVCVLGPRVERQSQGAYFLGSFDMNAYISRIRELGYKYPFV